MAASEQRKKAAVADPPGLAPRCDRTDFSQVLHAAWDGIVGEAVPARMLDLLSKLDAVDAPRRPIGRGRSATRWR